ncbi:MAG: hypothetical protein ACXWEG_01590 [Actinomycetota bacterium]
MDADAERLAAEEDMAWVRLHVAFERVPPERFEQPGLTSDGWSPRDAMFHVAAWCAEATNQLERMRMGTYVSARIDIEAQNRDWFEISKSLDVPTVKAELHAARTRMRQEWCELCEQAELTPDAIGWFEESGHIHYQGHRRELLTWLDAT